MKYWKDTAVSPVVGVMLMLVVTIIIAAVVSGFASGLVGSGSQKSPTLSMDVKISNSGSWIGSGFFATVTGVSEPIPTNSLKIVTAWTTLNRTDKQVITGGNSSVGGVVNVNVIEPDAGDSRESIAPYGFGLPVVAGQSGVTQSSVTPYKYPDQQFGNFTLTPGVSINAKPFGNKQDGSGSAASSGYGIDEKYEYTSDSAGYADPVQAVLGYEWQNLRVGDTVTVKVIYVPSGKTIFTKEVAVTEG